MTQWLTSGDECRFVAPRYALFHSPAALKVVTPKQPTDTQLQDLRFAWKVAHFVKSNAIVFCAGGMTLGGARAR